MPLVSTSRRRRASHRSAALNPSSDQGSRNQTTSSSSVHQQEATSQTEVALNPLHSTNNDLPLPPPIQQKSGDSSITIETIAIMATASFFVALVGLLSASGPGSWRFYVAGGTCAAISHAIATPIDVVKTRKQVDPDLLNTSFAKATARIVEKEGLKTLLSGLGPTTFGYLLEGSLKFGIYEILKPAAKRGLCSLAQFTSLLWLQSQFFSFAVCGAISGVAASLVLCPMEAIRIRLVAEPDFCTTNWIEGGYKMVKGEGFSALTKGLTPMLYKQVPYTISKNVAFDLLTRTSYSLLRTGGMAVTGMTKMLIPLVCALLTSILSTICSQPGDMLLSLVNAHEGTLRTNDFIRDILRRKDGGFRGFFVGTKSRFLHVGIIVTSQLILYDIIKRIVGVAATGSV
ncbi:hypothetical protein MHU86_5933 [Fragilaria crotonensis]|nr:hypothetical protein MHU86_5933 [Fragilaria crotonensis]